MLAQLVRVGQAHHLGAPCSPLEPPRLRLWSIELALELRAILVQFIKDIGAITQVNWTGLGRSGVHYDIGAGHGNYSAAVGLAPAT